MSDGPKFKCKSEAQKRAIRAYYARKGQGGAEKQAKEKYEREPKCRSYRDLRRDEEARAGGAGRRAGGAGGAKK